MAATDTNVNPWDDSESIPIEEFNRLLRAGDFAATPRIENYGDRYGEPYNPYRRVWGTLCSGRRVCSRVIPAETKGEGDGAD